MEYLMTYGWAILVIAVMLSVLFQLGIFGSSVSARGQPGNCKVYRPFGPGTTFNMNLEGTCGGQLPQYAAQFNGANSYVAPSTNLNFGTGDFTLIVWVRLGSLPGAWESVLDEGSSGTTGWGIHISSSNSITASIQAASGTNQHFSFYTATANTWYQIAVTFPRSDSIYGYVNGKLQGSQAYSAGNTNSVANSNLFTIGSHGGTTWYFNGLISNVQIYNASLSANEILALYNRGVGGAPLVLQNLVGWWPLNGDTSDYSGNGNDGTSSNIIFTSAWTTGYGLPH